MYRNRLTFGDLLKAHRILKGLSQEELSAACLYWRDRSCISKLERKIRKPKPETIRYLSYGLKLKGREKAVFYLLGRLNYLKKSEEYILSDILYNGEVKHAKTYDRTT